jgi:Ca2+:H+ antiporter
MIWGAIITLKFFTMLIAFYFKFMVDSISNIIANGTVSTTFVGLILLLIIRNAAEYITAVTVVYKDEMSLAINIITKSSI